VKGKRDLQFKEKRKNTIFSWKKVWRSLSTEKKKGKRIQWESLTFKDEKNSTPQM